MLWSGFMRLRVPFLSGLNEAEQNLSCALSHARLGSRPAGQTGHFLKCHKILASHYVKKEFFYKF